MKTRSRVLVMAALATLAPGRARTDDWPHLGRDETRSRAATEPTGTSFSGGSWSFSAGGTRIVSSPAVAEGYVVFGADDRKVRALREDTGLPAWEFTTGREILASPAVQGGRVIVPSADGKVHALRLIDGSVAWQASLGGHEYSSPTVSGPALILGGGFPRKRVLRLNGPDGSIAWETAPGAIEDIVNSSAAVSAGRVVIGTTGGRFYGLDASTGAVVWTFDAGGAVRFSSPLVSGPRAYLLPGGGSANLHAVDAATGSAVAGWPLAITDPVAPPPGAILNVDRAVSSPMAAGPLIIFQIRYDYTRDTDFNGRADTWTLREYVTAVDPAGPSVAWQVANGTMETDSVNHVPELGLCPTPAAAGGAVAVSSSLQARLRVLDPAASGAELWRTDLAGPGRASPVFANGRLFAATDSGSVHAFLSSLNAPPAAPAGGFLPGGGTDLMVAPTSVSWAAAAEPEGQVVTTLFRLDTDGEVLEDWLQETVTAPGGTSVTLGASPAPNVPYTWAVRSRDPNGAWSPWSEAQLFSVNMRPDPPGNLSASPGYQRMTLAWTPSPTADVTGYTLRYGGGGPVLLGNVTGTVVTGLVNGTAYTFDLRARDVDGHESDPATVIAVPVSEVTVGGVPYGSIEAAVAAALEGETVLLGPQTYALVSPITLREGISLRGVTAHETRIDATGLSAGVLVAADPDGGSSSIELLAVFGALIGIHVTDAKGVIVRNVLVRDCAQSGLELDAAATASFINGTLVANGTGARSAGALDARNSIVTGNGTGLVTSGSGSITSRHNDIVGNSTADLQGVTPGTGDLSMPVEFLDAAAKDYRERPGQPNVDAGDPADGFALEPAPNGGRINMGAFGNTIHAAPSMAGPEKRSGGYCSATAGASLTIPSAWMMAALILLGALRRRSP